MVTTEKVPTTYDEAVQALAGWHAYGESREFSVYACSDPRQETVRLIEVSPDFAATGRASAFAFGRAPDFPFPSAVIQLTPDEWDQVQSGALPLPDGWEASQCSPVQTA